MTRRYTKCAGALPALLMGTLLVTLFVFAALSEQGAKGVGMRAVFAEAVENGNFRRAQVAIAALLDQAPENSELMYQQAAVDLQLGNLDQARRQMHHLAQRYHHPMAALWVISRDFDMQTVTDWPPAAHTRFRELIETALLHAKDRDLDSTRILMASYLVAMGNYGESLRFYDVCVDTNRSQALSALSIAARQHDAQRVQRFARIATGFYEERLNAKPSDKASRLGLAQTWLLAGRPRDAAQLLSDGYQLEKDPELASLLGTALLAWANEISSTDDTALKRLQILQSAISLRPSDPLVAQSMIQQLIRCRDHTDARVQNLRDSILNSSEASSADFVKGTVALLENRFEEAINHLRAAGERHPYMPSIMNNLAVAISKTPGGNLEHALVLVNEALEQEPAQPYFLETRGSILAAMARWAEAIEDLEGALESPELRPLVFPALAKAYRQIGEDARAHDFDLLAREPN